MRPSIICLSILYCLFFNGACSSPDIILPHLYEIEIVGNRYEWHIRYPGLDGELHTEDDIFDKRFLRLPHDVETKINLKSNDFLYFLDFPDFRQTGMAVPEQTHSIQFVPTHKGTFELKGNQMCSYAHPQLIGELYVLSKNRFNKWTVNASSSGCKRKSLVSKN